MFGDYASTAIRSLLHSARPSDSVLDLKDDRPSRSWRDEAS